MIKLRKLFPSSTWTYAILGIVAGIMLPIFATIVETSSRGLTLTLANLVQTHSSTLLLWIMDTTPLVLGTLAGLVGRRQDNLSELNEQVEIKLQEEVRLRSELDQLTHSLETLVEERAQDAERRARYLEAAAEVGRAATSIYQLEELLPKVADLISEKFDFYQTGIFLLDDQREYAVMRAASSDGGKQMLARKHRLKVGEQGIVGFVTSTGTASIALDVGADAVHFNNPELPLTRSEMALPLFYGGQLIGALDVQSQEANAFSEQDISALNVLADQVSMAINNATLFQELQTSFEAERKAFGELTRSAWQELVRKMGTWGFKYANNWIAPSEKEWPADMQEVLVTEQAVKTNQGSPALAVPIKISDRTIGVVRVCKQAGHIDWTDDEVAFIQILSERLSQALESARLFQEAQKQAAQESLTSEISSQLRQTLDIDAVLQTAAKQLGEAFQAKEVIIRMAPDDSSN